jgi:hypothetical protein
VYFLSNDYLAHRGWIIGDLLLGSKNGFAIFQVVGKVDGITLSQ